VSASTLPVPVDLPASPRKQSSSAPDAHRPVPGFDWRTKLRGYVALTKPKVILLLEVPTLAAMLVAAPELPSIWLVLVTLLGGALAAGGAAAINCFIDRDIDALMGDRTRKRPIPAGIVSPREALLLGIGMGALSFVLLAAFATVLAAILAQVALLFYIFIYTRWLKRSTPSNIVIGGAAGAIPPLVGWAAVTGDLSAAAWILFAIIFFWTPPHFWALSLLIKEHYARANIPMLPVVRGDRETRWQIVMYTLQMIAVTVLLYGLRLSGLFYLGSALLLGAVFLFYAVRLYRHAAPKDASQLFHYSMLYLWLLSIAVVLDRRVFM
jgi:heme o synthase